MIRPTPDQAQAFERLRGTQVHAFYKAALCNCRDLLEKQADPRVIAIIQGEASALRSIVEIIDPTGKQA